MATTDPIVDGVYIWRPELDEKPPNNMKLTLEWGDNMRIHQHPTHSRQPNHAWRQDPPYDVRIVLPWILRGSFIAMIRIRIDELLREHERTLYGLAKEAGVSSATLARLEKDKAQGITFNTLEKICKALGCQPSDVLEAVIEIDARRGNERPFHEAATAEEWEAALDRFTRDPALQNISWPVDDSRESIYREREDAQL